MEERLKYVARVLAVVALACAGFHLSLLPLHAAGLVLTIAMLMLAAVCVRCAWHLWHVEGTFTWLVVGACAVAMLFLHERAMARSGHSLGTRTDHHGTGGYTEHAVAHSQTGSPVARLLMPLATSLAVIEIALTLIGMSLLLGARSSRITRSRASLTSDEHDVADKS